MAIEVHGQYDWEKLTANRLTVVLDPMVVRCGELFLRGASGTQNADSTWGLLSANLHAVGMFFDRIVLNETIPVFNYGDTFDAGLNLDQRVLREVNQHGPILIDVDVGYEAYHQVKSAALEEVKKLYLGDARIDPTLAKNIRDELNAAEYQWEPSLEDFGAELPSDDERRLAAFFLGGLIFGGYAQMLAGEHIVQPKRSRLFVAAHLREKSSHFELEDHLFGELKARAETHCEDLPWMPTFFPYLLSKADTPLGVLRQALALRESDGVDDYRRWLGEVLEDWNQNGRIGIEKKNDVQRVVQSIDRKLGRVATLPQVELKVSLADVLAAKPPGGIDVGPAVNALWGWCLNSLPGNRYRKLLARAVVKDSEYRRLTARLKTVWSAPQAQSA
jgi:hypothetical protein